MSNIVSAAGFQLRIVSVVSMTMTAAGSASSARCTRAAGAVASARAAAAACGAKPASGSTAAAWRGTEGMRRKMRHLRRTGGNGRERASSDSERPRDGEPGLGAAEEEVAVLADRVVEPVEDALLQLGREIDEDVATHEKVDMRQRRRLRQVVAAEDAPAADVPAEPIELTVAGEIALRQPVGDVLELLHPVQRVARRRERLFVDVGAVDLDRVVVRGLTQGLGQEHRDRIGLLAGRAAGAPDSDAPRVSDLVDDLRNDI